MNKKALAMFLTLLQDLQKCELSKACFPPGKFICKTQSKHKHLER